VTMTLMPALVKAQPNRPSAQAHRRVDPAITRYPARFGSNMDGWYARPADDARGSRRPPLGNPTENICAAEHSQSRQTGISPRMGCLWVAGSKR
jgi:hypothetical protein